MLARSAQRSPLAAALNRRSILGWPACPIALVALLISLTACTGAPPAPAGPPSAATTQGSAAPSGDDVAAPEAGPDRGTVTARGDHEFSSGAAARCSTAPGPADGLTAGSPDVRIELDPDDSPQPLFILTVPAVRGGGSYAAALSLRLDTADGTFTESTGSAVVVLDPWTDSAGGASGGTGEAGAPRLSGTFTAAYSGAAGDGEASGRFSECGLAPAGPATPPAPAATSPSP